MVDHRLSGRKQWVAELPGSTRVATTSCNERVASAWKHIMGDRRARLSLAKQLMCVRYYVNRRRLDRIKKEGFKSAFYHSDTESENETDDEC